MKNIYNAGYVHRSRLMQLIIKKHPSGWSEKTKAKLEISTIVDWLKNGALGKNSTIHVCWN